MGSDGFMTDSNAVLDILTDDPVWGAWALEAFARASIEGELIINQVILAEVSPGYLSYEEVNAALPQATFRRESLPWEAAFIAGQAHRIYRNRGGARRTPLGDFYIGAHAVFRGYTLITRDAARYRTYFPRLKLIAP